MLEFDYTQRRKLTTIQMMHRWKIKFPAKNGMQNNVAPVRPFTSFFFYFNVKLVSCLPLPLIFTSYVIHLTCPLNLACKGCVEKRKQHFLQNHTVRGFQSVTRNHWRTSNLVSWIRKGRSRYFCTTHLFYLISFGSPFTRSRIWSRRLAHLIPRKKVKQINHDFVRQSGKGLIVRGLSPLPLDFAPGLMIQMLWMPSISSWGLTIFILCSIALQWITK